MSYVQFSPTQLHVRKSSSCKVDHYSTGAQIWEPDSSPQDEDCDEECNTKIQSQSEKPTWYKHIAHVPWMHMHTLSSCQYINVYINTHSSFTQEYQ